MRWAQRAAHHPAGSSACPCAQNSARHSRTVCCELAQICRAALRRSRPRGQLTRRGSRPGSQTDRGLVLVRVEASTTGSRAVQARHRQSCLRVHSTVGRPSARGWPYGRSDQLSRRSFAHTFTTVWRSPVAISVPWRVRSSHTPGLMRVIVMRPSPRARRRRRCRCRAVRCAGRSRSCWRAGRSARRSARALPGRCPRPMR